MFGASIGWGAGGAGAAAGQATTTAGVKQMIAESTSKIGNSVLKDTAFRGACPAGLASSGILLRQVSRYSVRLGAGGLLTLVGMIAVDLLWTGTSTYALYHCADNFV